MQTYYLTRFNVESIQSILAHVLSLFSILPLYEFLILYASVSCKSKNSCKVLYWLLDYSCVLLEY